MSLREMPRLTILMTSVSASTAQMLLTGLRIRCFARQRPDVLQHNAKVAGNVLEELS